MRSINMQKKNEAKTEQTWSVKDFFHGTAGSPEQSRWYHFACSHSQSVFERTNERTDGQTDGRTDGRTDERKKDTNLS